MPSQMQIVCNWKCFKSTFFNSSFSPRFREVSCRKPLQDAGVNGVIAGDRFDVKDFQ